MIAPFGYLLILYILHLLYKKTLKEALVKVFTLIVIFELFLGVGYFVKIQKYELLYNEFLLVVLIVLCIAYMVKNKINKKILISSLLLLLSIVITQSSAILNPLNKLMVTYQTGWEAFFRGGLAYPSITLQSNAIIIRIIIFLIIAMIMNTVVSKRVVDNMCKDIVNVGIGIICLCVAEFLFKNIFNSSYISEMLDFIFGSGEATVRHLITRGSIKSIQGLMREPSHLAEGLFYFGVVVILSNNEKKYKWKIVMYAVITLLMSASLSGAGLGILLIVLLLVRYQNIAVLFSVAMMSLPILLPLILSIDSIQYYINRTINSINLLTGKLESSLALSESIRISSVIETLKLLFYRPLFGVGIGTTYAFGFLPTILATSGLIGFGCWFHLVFVRIGEIKFNKRNITIIIGLMISWILSGTIANMYSLLIILIGFELKYNKVNGIEDIFLVDFIIKDK